MAEGSRGRVKASPNGWPRQARPSRRGASCARDRIDQPGRRAKRRARRGNSNARDSASPRHRSAGPSRPLCAKRDTMRAGAFDGTNRRSRPRLRPGQRRDRAGRRGRGVRALLRRERPRLPGARDRARRRIPAPSDASARTSTSAPTCPRYFIYRDGELAEETRRDYSAIWRRGFRNAFVIGCSFTFENALREAGVPLRHVELQNRNVAMYRTNAPYRIGRSGSAARWSSRCGHSRPKTRTGRPRSARGIRPCTAPRSIAATPLALGIADLSQTGLTAKRSPMRCRRDVPLFWACGVTSQVALQSARLPLFIAHAPGCMLITDLTHASLAG